MEKLGTIPVSEDILRNSLEDWKKARELGADAVTTDIPMQLLKQIKETK